MKKKHLRKNKGIPMFSYSGRHKTSHSRDSFYSRAPLGVSIPSLKEIKRMVDRGSQLVTVEKGKIGERKVIYLHNIGYKVITDQQMSTIISLMPIR